MANKVNLQKIKSEIETKQAELEKYEKKIVQLKNREKQIKKWQALRGEKRGRTG